MWGNQGDDEKGEIALKEVTSLAFSVCTWQTEIIVIEREQTLSFFPLPNSDSSNCSTLSFSSLSLPTFEKGKICLNLVKICNRADWSGGIFSGNLQFNYICKVFANLFFFTLTTSKAFHFWQREDCVKRKECEFTIQMFQRGSHLPFTGAGSCEKVVKEEKMRKITQRKGHHLLRCQQGRPHFADFLLFFVKCEIFSINFKEIFRHLFVIFPKKC